MTDIYDINLDDVKLFLIANKEDVPINDDESYELAWELMQNPNSKFIPTSIIEFMMAYNNIIKNKKISLYSVNEIKQLSDLELRKLATSLSMKGTDINNVINILRYMDKLTTDNIISILPEEIILELFKQSDINDIKNFCLINKNNKLSKVCRSKDLLDIVKSKFKGDSLDTSDFTLEELFFYNKILPLKKIKTDYYELSNNSRGKNVNQIIKYESSNNHVILFNDRKVFFDKNEINLSGVKIVDINDDSSLLSSVGDCYFITGEFKIIKIEIPFKILQKTKNLVLSLDGDVYFMYDIRDKSKYTYEISYKSNYFIKIFELSNIIQITNQNFLLSATGEVYKISLEDLSVKKYVTPKKIIQIDSGRLGKREPEENIGDWVSFSPPRYSNFSDIALLLDINNDAYSIIEDKVNPIRYKISHLEKKNIDIIQYNREKNIKLLYNNRDIFHIYEKIDDKKMKKFYGFSYDTVGNKFKNLATGQLYII